MRELTSHSANGGRRNFVSRLSTLIGLGCGFHFSRTPLRSQTHYPKPTYVPPGYQPAAFYTGRSDGFGGGDSEFCIIYINPTIVSKSGGGFTHPLQIFYARTPKKPMSGTIDRAPTPIEIAIRGVIPVTAEYWDGTWRHAPDGDHGFNGQRFRWTNDDAHSLAFRFGTLTVGIRAFRSGNVTLEEMKKIAASLQ